MGGYLEPDEELEDNCENGTYDCDTCVNNGDCLRQGIDGSVCWMECEKQINKHDNICRGCLYRGRCDHYDEPDPMWIVGRAIEGVSINGLEYMLDDKGEPMRFETEDEAVEYLKSLGLTDEQIEELDIVEEDEDETD